MTNFGKILPKFEYKIIFFPGIFWNFFFNVSGNTANNRSEIGQNYFNYVINL